MQKTIFYFQCKKFQVICHPGTGTFHSETEYVFFVTVRITFSDYFFTGRFVRLCLKKELPEFCREIRQFKLEGCYA